MILALVGIPLVAGLAAFRWRSAAGRYALLIAAAAAHAALTAAAWHEAPAPACGGWLALDSLGLLFLSITSTLFLVSAVYLVGYLRRERASRHVDFEEGLLFRNEPEAVFIGCLLVFLAAMTLVTLSQHFGLLWVSIEATTLASAPLIYFHRHHRSLEATWKYLVLCSVGIAVALLGNFVLALAASPAGEEPIELLVGSLVAESGRLDVGLVRVAFLLSLVGYGTKTGLAPLHNWLPDAHSESPSAVSALLSGALLNCALVGILRAHQVSVAVGEQQFSGDLLVLFGLISIGVAAAFIFGQGDFKRLLAYSSVEHMGILAVGFGLGGAGLVGAGLHAVNHSLTKAALFLVAGNILAVYGTKQVRKVQGLFRVLPISGALWMAGFLAITGTPPFGVFLSELAILKAALDQDRVWVAAAYLALLGLVFIGMGSLVLHMVQGPAGQTASGPRREPWWSIAAPMTLCGLVLLLGLYVPGPLYTALGRMAELLGGG